MMQPFCASTRKESRTHPAAGAGPATIYIVDESVIRALDDRARGTRRAAAIDLNAARAATTGLFFVKAIIKIFGQCLLFLSCAHCCTKPITVVCGGMLGCRVGQRVAGWSKFACGVAPGCRATLKIVRVFVSNAAPPIAAPIGAR
jgi:hypothetical protein